MMTSLRTMQASGREIPQQQLPILPNASKPIPLLHDVASFDVPLDAGHKAAVTLAASDDPLVAEGEDGNEVVLAGKEDEARVGREGEGGETSKVRWMNVRESASKSNKASAR